MDRKREERPRYRSAKSLNSDRRKLISRYSHVSRAGVCPAVGCGDFEQPSYVTESKLIPEAVPRLDTGTPYRAIRDFPFNFRLIIIMGGLYQWLSLQASANGFFIPPYEQKPRELRSTGGKLCIGLHKRANLCV